MVKESGVRGNGQTHPVALKKPVGELFDTHGNVWEWTQDWYSETPLAGINPQGPSSGAHRVVRGGSWSNSPQDLRGAGRDGGPPGFQVDDLGFRLVRTPKN